MPPARGGSTAISDPPVAEWRAAADGGQFVEACVRWLARPEETAPRAVGGQAAARYERTRTPVPLPDARWACPPRLLRASEASRASVGLCFVCEAPATRAIAANPFTQCCYMPVCAACVPGPPLV